MAQEKGGGSKTTAQILAARYSAAPPPAEPISYWRDTPIPSVAPVVTPTVQTSLQSINAMPAPSFTGSEPKVSSLYQPVQTAGFQNVVGTATVTPAAGTAPGAYTGSEPKDTATYQPPPLTIGGGNPTIKAGVPGELPYYSPSEPKGETYYPPQTTGTGIGVAGAGANLNMGLFSGVTGTASMTPTAGTLPGAFTGSEPKAPAFYEPPSAGKAQQLTLADLGLEGQVQLNTLEGGRGWYLPWWQNGVQGSLDWSTGTFYPAYPLAGGGNAGGGESGGGETGGAGGAGSGAEGVRQPRAGGMVGGLVNWRIGT